MFMGAFGTDVGIFGTAFTYSFREREAIQDLFEQVSVDRTMYAYFRPGGVVWEVQPNFAERVREVLDSVRRGIRDIDGLLTHNEIFIARTRGVGELSREDAIEWGTTGPIIRAAGVPLDLRKTEPYLYYDYYDQIDFDVPVGERSDVYDRYLVRLQEMWESVRIVEQCLERLEPGPILPARMPRMLRTPPGEVYMRTEAPRGEYGIYLVSNGSNRPYRLKIRSSCFANLQALREMTIGNYFADAIVILGSLDIVLCEVDR